MTGIQSQGPCDSMPRVDFKTQLRFTLLRCVPRKRRQQASKLMKGIWKYIMGKGKVGTDNAKYQCMWDRGGIQKNMNASLRLSITRIPPSDDVSPSEKLCR